MSRADQHIYLVMTEKICKKSKREMQRLLEGKKPPSKSINDLIKILTKVAQENMRNTVKTMLEVTREVKS